MARRSVRLDDAAALIRRESTVRFEFMLPSLSNPARFGTTVAC
jgi:hypothetical protein